MSVFREQQQFREPWLWIVFACVTLPILGLLGYALHQQLVLGHPVGDRPLGNAGLVALFAGVLLLHVSVIAMFWFARLEVEVTPSHVVVRFRPFHRTPRRIPLQQIADARARRYSALGEYGGWGVRVGFSGTAYNVSGDHGVQLTLVGGKRILIGSQKSDELEAAILGAKAAA